MVAACGPADRSTVIVTSRGRRSTLDLSSPAQPFRQTQTPLIATLSRSGSNSASVVPTAESTLPQFGSSPAMAHLTSADRATALPAARASSSLAAPTTSIAIALLAPSASACSWRARSAQTSVRTRVKPPGDGRAPAAPLASSSTVSLVDMQPSVSSRSKVIRVAACRAVLSSAASRSASVVTTHNMVASAGAIMPAPLAMPPLVEPSARWKAIVATVSVVLMASAAASPPTREASATAASAPASRRSIGRRSPISPVEQMAISPAESPSAVARRSALVWVSVKPSGPVQAFAPPELRSTARTRPPRTTCCVHSTGAAFTRLAVNTAAAARDGPSLTTTATSRAPDGLSPAATPAARNPSGAVTLICLPPLWALRWVMPAAVSWRDSLRGQARCLRQAEHEVGGLYGLPGRALAQVVQRGDHDAASSVGVDGCLQVHGVGADRRGRGGPAALGEQVDEGLAGVGVVQGCPHRRCGGRRAGQPCGAGGENATRHWSQHRRERDGWLDGIRGRLPGLLPAGRRRQGLLDLGRMPVRPAHLVGGHGAHYLGREQRRRCRAAGAGGARGRDDHDVARLGQAGGEQRCERNDRRGGIAARGRDAARGADPGPRAGQFGQAVGPAPRVAGPVVGGPCLRIG